MALVHIGQVQQKKKLRFGLAQKVGAELRSSVQRMSSAVGEKATSTTKTGLQKIEGRVQEALKFDPFAGKQPAEAAPQETAEDLPDDEGAPVESASPEALEAIASGLDQLEGLTDYAGMLTDAGRGAEARALIGALETILRVTKTNVMEIQGDRSAARGQAPAAPAMPAQPVMLTPADEGPIEMTEPADGAQGFVHAGQVWGGDSNAYNRFPGTVGPPASTAPIFARPNGPKRIGVSPAFGPEAGLVVIPRRVRGESTVEVVPEIMRRPGGMVPIRPRRSVPPFSWRNR